MRRCVCCLLLLLGLVSPTALALDEETAAQATQAQSEAFGFDDLERIGEAYTGQEDIAGGVDVPGAFRHVGQTAKDNLGQVVKTAVRSCVLLLAVTLLWGLAQGMQAGAGESGGLEAITLAAVLAITAVAVGDVHSLLSLGEEAIYNMETLGDVLLPAVSMATAASGSPAMAVVKHGATILFSDFLLRLIHSLLIPLCYAFVAANVAWAALANEGLKRLAGFLKWLITMILSVVLLVFVGYLNLSGVISGGADAATVKAAKFTLSNLVPVVGGVISDTAETLLAGAADAAQGVLNVLAAAVYGDVGVLLIEGDALVIEHAEGLTGTEDDAAFFQVPQAAGQGFVAQLEVDDGAELGEMGHGFWFVDHAAAGGDDGIVDVQLGADGFFQSQEAVAAVGADELGEQGVLSVLDDQVRV